jgi:hypothetical protein
MTDFNPSWTSREAIRFVKGRYAPGEQLISTVISYYRKLFAPPHCFRMADDPGPEENLIQPLLV